MGGYQLHIHCLGEGNPTVILEAALPGASAHWGWVQPDIATTTRVCAYDRAGMGWSDPGPEPRDAQTIASELHTLLDNARIEGPYVLVGHSFGGLYARMYTAQYPDEVAGMVLVDSTHPDQWTRLPPEVVAGAIPDERLLAILRSWQGLASPACLVSFQQTPSYQHSTARKSKPSTPPRNIWPPTRENYWLSRQRVPKCSTLEIWVAGH